MATIGMNANNPWTGSPYATIDAGSSSQQLVSTGSLNTTTSPAGSGAFTITNAAVIDGVFMKVLYLGGGGTFTVSLFDGTSDVRSVTVNAADMRTFQTLVFFKFGSTYTSTGLATMKIRVSSSIAGTIQVFGSGVLGNCYRALRTTTTAVQAIGDTRLHAKEWTAAATSIARTLVVDSTTTTANTGLLEFGDVMITPGTAANTAYNWYFTSAANVNLYSGAILDLGYTTPLASGSTFLTNITSGAGGFTLTLLGDAIARGIGTTKTRQVLLSADVAAGASTLNLASTPTGWAANDILELEATGSSFAQYEEVTILSIVGSVVTLTAPTSFAHIGTGTKASKVGNCTSSIAFRAPINISWGVSLSAQSTFDFAYCEFSNLTWGINTTTGIFRLSYCAVHSVSGNNFGSLQVTSATSGTAGGVISVDNCVIYSTSGPFFRVEATSGTWTFTNNLCIKSTSTGLLLNDVGGTCTGNWISGCGITVAGGATTASCGMQLNETGGALGTFSGNTIHNGNTAEMLSFPVAVSGIFGSITLWNGRSFGAKINPATVMAGCTIDSITAFGNVTANVQLDSCTLLQCVLSNWTCNAGTTVTSPIGVQFSTNVTLIDTELVTWLMGQTTQHSTGDIDIVAGTATTAFLPVRSGWTNSVLNSTVPLNGQANIRTGGELYSDHHGQVATDYRTYTSYYTIQPDTTFTGTGSKPSERCTPLASTYNCRIGRQAAKASDTTLVTITAKLRKSVVGDGTAWNGGQITMMLEADPVLGVNTDTQLAITTSSADGAFQTLTGTFTPSVAGTFNVFFQGAASAGWYNVVDIVKS